ncbi:MAG: rhomboid family intramembrane serine protease [Brevundimonas sp.]
MFNAPLVAVGIAVSMPVLYWLQLRLPDGGLSLAFRPSSLWDGGWWPGVLTSMLVHGGWPHVGMNAIMGLAFGAPVARLMPGARGAMGFLAFYIVCGLLATAGYGLAHPASYDALVGASGAVFGLMGAALRLLGRKSGKLRSLTDNRFMTPAAAIMAVNAAVGLLGFAPGMEGARIAWEAHAFGFVAGALLIGPWASVFRARPVAFDSAPDLRDPDA